MVELISNNNRGVPITPPKESPPAYLFLVHTHYYAKGILADTNTFQDYLKSVFHVVDTLDISKVGIVLVENSLDTELKKLPTFPEETIRDRMAAILETQLGKGWIDSDHIETLEQLMQGVDIAYFSGSHTNLCARQTAQDIYTRFPSVIIKPVTDLLYPCGKEANIFLPFWEKAKLPSDVSKGIFNAYSQAITSNELPLLR